MRSCSRIPHRLVRAGDDRLLRRTLARLDVSSRTLFAIIEQGSCFAGTLFELALAADRSYMLLCRRSRSARLASRCPR